MIAQVLPLLVVFVLVAAGTWWYRRANGAAFQADATFGPEEVRALGLPPRRGVLLLFTAPGCPSCAAAQRVLEAVTARRSVPVVVADVTEHAGIAARLHIYRAPTTFLVDDRGHAGVRISGVPRDEQLEAALQPRRLTV